MQNEIKHWDKVLGEAETVTVVCTHTGRVCASSCVFSEKSHMCFTTLREIISFTFNALNYHT